MRGIIAAAIALVILGTADIELNDGRYIATLVHAVETLLGR
jgi:hypothetical protein